MNGLAISTDVRGEVVIITVTGEIDVHTVSGLREQFRVTLNEGYSDIIVDIDGVSFLDSTGIGVLAGLHNRIGRLRIVCSQKNIIKIMQLTGLIRVFAIYETLNDALVADS